MRYFPPVDVAEYLTAEPVRPTSGLLPLEGKMLFLEEVGTRFNAAVAYEMASG